MAAEGPYFIKSWVPIGSLFLSFEVPISFGNSVTVRYPIFLLMTSLRADAEIFIFGEICTPGAGGIGWYRAKVIMALNKIHWVYLVQVLCINMGQIRSIQPSIYLTIC